MYLRLILGSLFVSSHISYIQGNPVVKLTSVFIFCNSILQNSFISWGKIKRGQNYILEFFVIQKERQIQILTIDRKIFI